MPWGVTLAHIRMMRVIEAERAIHLSNATFVGRMRNGEDAATFAQQLADTWQAVAQREPVKRRKAPPIPRHLLPALGIELEEPNTGGDVEHR